MRNLFSLEKSSFYKQLDVIFELLFSSLCTIIRAGLTMRKNKYGTLGMSI